MKLISFGHRARVGKDTACDVLKREYNAQKYSFAYSLKDICYSLYWWTGIEEPNFYELHPSEKEIEIPKLGMTPRDLFVKFGTKIARDIYADTFSEYVRHLMLERERLSGPEHLKCISDMRFPNEFKMVRELGGYCVRIDRPCVDVLDDEADDALADETDWDAIIVNDGTIEQFRVKIIKVMTEFKL